MVTRFWYAWLMRDDFEVGVSFLSEFVSPNTGVLATGIPNSETKRTEGKA